MEFIYPWYLVGLAAVSIPIVIHLFNFHRYKKVYFTNVRFLQAIQSETHRSSRLRNLILLLLRILFIIALVMVFAQPYIPASNNIRQGSPFAVSIYIDNSQSMETGAGNENLLHQAREKALEIVNSFTSTDKFQLLTNDMEGKYQHFVPANEANIWVNDVKSSLAYVSASTLLQTQAKLLHQEKNYNHLAFFISDFAKSTFSLPTNPDTNITWVFVPVQSTQPFNVSIDTCWFDMPIVAPGLESRLNVNLTNHSPDQSRELIVKLSTNGIQRGLKSLTLTPKTTSNLSFQLMNADTGSIEGLFQINDNGFTFDDELYFSYAVHPKLQILIVNGGEENSYFNRLFHSDSLMQVDNQPLHRLDYSRLEKSYLTILNELTEYPEGLILSIQRSLEAGHSIAILPHPSKGIEQLEQFLFSLGGGLKLLADTSSTAVSQINLDHFIFKPAIERMPSMPLLPSVRKYFKINLTSRSGYDVLMTLRNGDPFLIAKNLNNGHLFLQATPLRPEFTDFMHNNLFVVAYLNMAISGQYQNPLYAVYGKPSLFYFEKSSETTVPAPHLISSHDKIDVIPFYRDLDGQSEIIIRTELPEAGIYRLKRDDKWSGYIALNASRIESSPHCFSVDELDKMLQQRGWANSSVMRKDDDLPIKVFLAQTIDGIKLWKSFLVAALILLAAEVTLLRFWK